MLQQGYLASQRYLRKIYFRCKILLIFIQIVYSFFKLDINITVSFFFRINGEQYKKIFGDEIIASCWISS